jgi:hypothetical protein
MAVSAVTSSTSAAAQLLEQTRQLNARPEARETNQAEATEKPAQQRMETQETRPQAAQPVVNAQGQTTGQIVNTFV